jgi:hypothetical protein
VQGNKGRKETHFFNKLKFGLMGVDYDAVFGLGSRITKIAGKSIEDFEIAIHDGKVEGHDDGIISYLDAVVTQDGVSYGYAGNEYTNDTPEIFLLIAEPDFSNLNVLGAQIKNFERVMELLGFEGEPVGVVGGLHIW